MWASRRPQDGDEGLPKHHLDPRVLAALARSRGNPATAPRDAALRDARAQKPAFTFQPGQVIVDEAHTVRKLATGLWQCIRKLASRAGSPLFLLALSATPMPESPADLEPFLVITTEASVA